MKVRFYMDVYPGWKAEFATTSTNPSWEKPVNGRRLSFEIEVPDYLIQPAVDVKLQELFVAKEVP